MSGITEDKHMTYIGFLLIMLGLSVRAEEDVERIRSVEAGEIFPILTMAYCHADITATGRRPRQDICAVREEWICKTVLMWECKDSSMIREVLGYWECLDTGFGEGSDGDGMSYVIENCIKKHGFSPKKRLKPH